MARCPGDCTFVLIRDEINRDVLEGWFRKYVIAPQYPRRQRERLLTDDGVRLRAHRVTPVVPTRGTAVLVHGFASSSRTPAIYAMAHALARHGLEVIAPDLRGHGGSRGRCTLGSDEPRDVEAAVAVARRDLPVVTVGVSLGAAACIVHAGTYGGVAATVAISSPARWTGTGHLEASDRVGRYASSRKGRALLTVVVRTRLAPRRAARRAPEDVIADIAPARTVIVHDPSDHFFDGTHATALFEAAREPKQLWWYRGRGHGVDLFDPDLADRIARLFDEVAGEEPSGSGVELLGHQEPARPLGAGVTVDDLPEPRGVSGLD